MARSGTCGVQGCIGSWLTGRWSHDWHGYRVIDTMIVWLSHNVIWFSCDWYDVWVIVRLIWLSCDWYDDRVVNMMIVWLTCWLWLIWWSCNWYNHRVTHMTAALIQVWRSRGLFSDMSGLGLGLVWRWLSHESMRYVWHMWYVWYAWYVSVAYVLYVVCAVYEVYAVNARCAIPVVVKWSCFEACIHLI